MGTGQEETRANRIARKRIEGCALDLGKTLSAISENLGVSKRALIDAASGRVRVSVDLLEKASEAFGCSIAYLVGDSEEWDPSKNTLGIVVDASTKTAAEADSVAAELARATKRIADVVSPYVYRGLSASIHRTNNVRAAMDASVEALERELFRFVLERNNWNIAHAARSMGRDRTSFPKSLEKAGLLEELEQKRRSGAIKAGRPRGASQRSSVTLSKKVMGLRTKYVWYVVNSDQGLVSYMTEKGRENRAFVSRDAIVENHKNEKLLRVEVVSENETCALVALPLEPFTRKKRNARVLKWDLYELEADGMQ